MQLTAYQKIILQAVGNRILIRIDTKKGLLIEALAGTGKSTTLTEIAKLLKSLGIPPTACRFLVFGKKNSLDLKAKFKAIGPGWDKAVQTLNSLGYELLRNALGKSAKYFDVNGSKYLHLSRDLGYLNKRDKDGNETPGSLTWGDKPIIESDKVFTDLLEKIRLHCYRIPTIDIECIDSLDKRYGWEFKRADLETLANAAQHCLQKGLETVLHGSIDFLDQIFYLWHEQERYAKTFSKWRSLLQFIAIDEAQDTDPLQIQYLKLLHDPCNNFLCAVGDRYQAVYYFRGCLSNGLDVITEEFNCESLPLPVNYRCGRSHLELVRQLYSHIEIEPHDSAPPGEIRCILDSQLIDMVSDRSLSYFGIARKNAPLLTTAIKFLTHGIPAKIKDRNLGKKILQTIERAVGGKKRYDPTTFINNIEDWAIQQKQRYSSEQKHQEINDLKACLIALFQAYQLDSLDDWDLKINEIFDESKTNEKPVDLYTVHTGKGGQGDVAFVVYPNEMPITFKGQSDEEKQQEQNMIYVALTRCSANEKPGSGIFYLILKKDEEDDKEKILWPDWLPKKYRQLWNEPPENEDKPNDIIDVAANEPPENEEEPNDVIDAAAEESPYFSGEGFNDFASEIWSCPVCDADNFETATCYQCGYQRFPEDEAEDDNINGFESEKTSLNAEHIEVAAESSEHIEVAAESSEHIEVAAESSEPEPETSPTPASFESHKSKSERVREVLLSGSDLSGEQIAAQCGCSAMLVSKVRKKLEGEGLLEPVGVVKTANGRVMNVTDIGTISHSPRRSKLEKVRLLMEDLTGHELRLLFEEFIGPLPPNYSRLTSIEEEDDNDIPF